MPGRLILVLALAFATLPASAEDFCAELDVPAALDLVCSEAADGSTVVAAPDSPLAALNRLRVRRLDAPVDDPAAWLEEQMTLDTTGLSGFVERWAMHPDNPLKPEAVEPSMQALADALDRLGRLGRSGCEAPREQANGRWTMRCTYDAGVAEGVVQLDLFAGDGLPVATDFRAASPQRTRQLQALVNGLRLD